MEQQPLLDVRQLYTHFRTERARVTAVSGVDLQVSDGEILGVVGESGSGKSVMAQSIMRLLDEDYITTYDGKILLKGTDLLTASRAQMRKVRGNEISMIFQDPLSSLNPVYTIGDQIKEAILLHQDVTKKKATEIAIDLLRLMRIPLPEKRMKEYPHQLSGGMQQRVMIAMALASRPALLIADEPTTALDVTTQAQILELIKDLNQEFKMGVIFITHDLGVVTEICTRVVVMYLGQVVEEAEVKDLFKMPLHPYTKGLLKAMPSLDADRTQKLPVIEGTVPSLENVPSGCRFRTRCPYATEVCREKEPVLENHTETHKVRCWHYKEIMAGEAGDHKHGSE